MKSRTSFFNKTVFLRNTTRFAPVWVAYSIFLLLVISSLAGLRTEYIRAINAADMTTYMAVINLIYAFFLVQMLFGDLYNARLCNALHAMPLTRECWFGTNLICAFAFSLVPNVVAMLIAMPILGNGWIIALYWFAASLMQFIFFLGTAAFSAMLVGNRFAMLAVYVLVNFLSILFYWFAETLYQPLMYGVRFTNDIYIRLSPCAQMANFHQLVLVLSHPDMETAIQYTTEYNGIATKFATGNDGVFSIGAGTGWGYHAICTILGAVLLRVALQLYRKRKLETAGDFIAFRAVEPVFLTLFSLGVGAFFQLFAELFGLMPQLLFLAVGLAVGYYAGRMLMMRTTRVFQPKALIGLAAIAAVLAGSLILVKVDAFGIVRYVPEVSEVEDVTIGNYYYYGSNGFIVISDPDQIEEIQDIHRDALANPTDQDGYYTSLNLIYTMKDGTTVERYYSDIRVDSYAGQALKPHYSAPEYVLGLMPTDYASCAENINYFWYSDINLDEAEVKDYDMLGLLEAIDADCRAGNMAQDIAYHVGEQRMGYVEFQWEISSEYIDYRSITIYESCKNTLQWLEDNGFEIEEGSMIGG